MTVRPERAKLLQNLAQVGGDRRALDSQFVDSPIIERSYEYALLRLPERFEQFVDIY
jgi:hypothetical protein